ncbi:hypothetical protein QYE76_049262 [Lolium multiflorum]|uniref:Uncharacterized protein n=1 Tax=Lolium multiflorum TaxID=4521 RepID=A0AAD8WI75_LOLMU|nr:hypothetical protein QYE76_049262 [Lolium multiflorum]
MGKFDLRARPQRRLDFLGRPHPEFHGIQLDDQPGGELQWVINAELRGKMEPPTSERILFSFRESNRSTDLHVPSGRHLRVSVDRTWCAPFPLAHLDRRLRVPNQTHAHIIEQGEAIKLLANNRKTLHQQRAKKDTTIVRLRAKIASLEATVKAQEDQLREMEEDDGGIDLQGGGAFLSDDNDFEEDEFTEKEDYEFLEAGPDDFAPIDVEDEE